MRDIPREKFAAAVACAGCDFEVYALPYVVPVPPERTRPVWVASRRMPELPTRNRKRKD